MTRRFDVGPLLLALGGLALVAALFLRWFGALSAWDAFEITDLLLAALGVAAVVLALGLISPGGDYLDRRWLPWIVGAVVVVVAVELIDPPPVAAGREPGTGAWLALAAAGLMLVGAVLSFGRVSLAVAVEGRDLRRRVAAVDHRPPPTSETGPFTPVRAPRDGQAEEPGATAATQPLRTEER